MGTDAEPDLPPARPVALDPPVWAVLWVGGGEVLELSAEPEDDAWHPATIMLAINPSKTEHFGEFFIGIPRVSCPCGIGVPFGPS